MRLSNPKKEWLLGTLLLVLSSVAYLPVLQAGFVWDDVVMVTDNRCLRGWHGLHDIWFTTKTTDVYPITFTCLWVEWQLWGANPIGYHVVNVLLHAVGALLLWRLLKTLSVSGAWVASLLFALHPVTVASVAWVSERKNTLSLVFFLLALLAYEKFRQSTSNKWYALSITAFAFALASKTSVVMLPVILLLMGWWKTGHIVRKDIVRATPFFLLSFIFGLVTIWNQHYHAIGDSIPQQHTFLEKLAGTGCVVVFYLWKDLVPTKLSVIYPQWQLHASNPFIYIPVLLIMGVFIIGWKSRTTWGRHLLFAFGYFVVTLFPVMGFFDMYFLTFSRVADHLQYLALAGFVPLVVAGACALANKFRVPLTSMKAAVPVIAVLFAYATWTRASIYQNEEKLWRDTINKNPNAWMAFNNLGNSLFAQKRNAEARTAYESALAVNPDFPDANSNLGNLLVETKDLDAAVRHLKRATEVQPKNPKFHFNLGVALAEQRKYDEALLAYSTALQLRPNYADVHNNIAHILLKQGKWKDALQHATTALQLNPNSPEAHFNAGEAASNLDQTQQAISLFEGALKLRPDFASAHHSLGLLLAMNNQVDAALPHFREAVRLQPGASVTHASFGNALAITKHLDEAITEFEWALRIDPKNAEAHGNLANALSEKARYAEASEHYARALAIDPNNLNACVNFALTLEHQGKTNEALAQYHAALKLKPGDAMLQRQIRALTQSH